MASSSVLSRRKYRERGDCYRCGGKYGKVVRAKQCERCWELEHETDMRRKAERKAAVYENYGGYKCVCCGETNPGFLTVDHINGGGSKHKKDENFAAIVDWLYYHGMPEGYQIMCYNCNCGRGRRNYKGVCPHKLNKIFDVGLSEGLVM